jgi:hypothetical protein
VERCHRVDRKVDKQRIVADPIDQGNAAENQIARRLDRRLFQRKLHDGSNAIAEEPTKILAIAGMANPKQMRLDLVHRNSRHPNPRHRDLPPSNCTTAVELPAANRAIWVCDSLEIAVGLSRVLGMW